MKTTRQKYPSDLDDKQWLVLEPFFRKISKKGRPAIYSPREILNAIFYIARTGCSWRMMPNDLPPWKTVYHYFRKWKINGLYQLINDNLSNQIRKNAGHDNNPTKAIIDSQSVKTTSVAGNRGFDAAKKIVGRKRHIIVDSNGFIFGLMVHQANIQDRDGAKLLLEKCSSKLDDGATIYADSAYSGQLQNYFKEKFNLNLEIIKRPSESKGFVVLPKRWIVERTFGWINRFKRNSKDYEVLESSSESFIYLSMIYNMLRVLSLSVVELMYKKK